MISYASKRITRGRSLFIALFMSVALAATLFSGILQGADAVAGSLINNMLSSTDYDIITTTDAKNVTSSKTYEIDAYFGGLDGVEAVNHFIRMDVDINSTILNVTLPTKIVAVPSSSPLLSKINGTAAIEDGKIYMDIGSINATRFTPGSEVSVGILTFKIYGDLADVRRLYFDAQVGETITIDDQAWCIFMEYYGSYLSAVLGGSPSIGGRPQYNLVVVSENTYRSWLDQIYHHIDKRQPTRIYSIATIRFERGALINQWDIPGTQSKLSKIDEQINGMGGIYGYIPRDYLKDVLNVVASNSANIKLSTIIVTTPVFFTAWYLGMTVSDVALGLRRREIALLLTRGLSHRQVILTLLTEALFMSVFAGVIGIILGAVILPFVIPGSGIWEIFRYVTPVTFAATIGFSLGLAVLAAYNPVRKATEMEIVDALRVYRAEEETLGGWAEPLMAFLLGLYKLIALIIKLDVTAYSPTSTDFISFLLYNTWYGLDYILGFIWTILLFWGFIKLLLMYAPQFQGLLGGLAARITGDAARFTSLSSRRNLRRTAAYTFMTALVISYSVVVIGNSALITDFTDRYFKAQFGADISVSIYKKAAAFDIAAKIREMPSVEAAAVEVGFIAQTSIGDVPVRAIEVQHWNKTAYLEERFIDKNLFPKMNTKDSAIIERGAAELIGVRPDGTGNMNIRLEARTFTINIVGVFGRDLGDSWTIQNPTIYLPVEFVSSFEENWVSGTRIIVKLKPNADVDAFTRDVKALDQNVQRVDVMSVLAEGLRKSVAFTGPQQVVQLGIVFAVAVSSLGVLLVVYTLLRSRWTELNLMSIRGFSAQQLSLSILTENLGLAIFATILGISVGIVSLLGQVQLYNSLIFTGTEWRLSFPLESQLRLAGIILIIVAATAAPILLIVRRVSEEPSLKGE